MTFAAGPGIVKRHGAGVPLVSEARTGLFLTGLLGANFLPESDEAAQALSNTALTVAYFDSPRVIAVSSIVSPSLAAPSVAGGLSALSASGYSR